MIDMSGSLKVSSVFKDYYEFTSPKLKTFRLKMEITKAFL